MTHKPRRYLVRIGHRGYEQGAILRSSTLLFVYDSDRYGCPMSQALCLAKDFCARKERRLEAIMSCAAPLIPSRGVVSAEGGCR